MPMKITNIKKTGLALLALCSAATATTAFAQQAYDVTFISPVPAFNISATVDASSTTNTLMNGGAPGYDVTGITGTVNGATITGLISNPSPPAVATSPDGLYYFNNVLYPDSVTGAVDLYGLLFTAGGFDYNLYTNNGVYELSTTDPASNGNFQTEIPGVLTVAAVPEAATWAMMLLGFGGIGFAMRRQRDRKAALAQLA